MTSPPITSQKTQIQEIGKITLKVIKENRVQSLFFEHAQKETHNDIC